MDRTVAVSTIGCLGHEGEASALKIGETLRGKYEVEGILGEGGMGLVVRAHHLALGQSVAIKLLRAALREHPEIAERFTREARAASRLKSDHVARVTDVDKTEDGTPFMVMELLEGSDLSFVRRDRRSLPIPTIVGWILEACDAIGEAHRLGIVHRDIKPANLFLARLGDDKTRVKVLDFGISKTTDPTGPTSSSITKTSMVMGSAEYMSPEQMLSSKDVDRRTDIWALGVTLYELMTTCVPFPGDSITQVCALVMTRDPAPPSSLRADVPRELDAVVLKCLARERVDRFSSIPEVVRALSPFGPERASRDRISEATLMAAVRATESVPSVARSDTAILVEDPSLPSTEKLPTSPSTNRSGTRLSGSTTAALSSEPIAPTPTTPVRGGLLVGACAIAVVAAGIYLSRDRAPVSPASAALPSASSGPVEPATLANSPAPPTPVASAPSPPPTATASASAHVARPPATADDRATAPVHIANVPQPAKPPLAADKRQRGAARPAAAAKTAEPAAKAPAPNCNPPYAVDAAGDRHIKPGCD